MERNKLSHNFTNVISERIKQPKSPLNRGDAKFMMQFWFTAKFGKRSHQHFQKIVNFKRV